MSQTSLACVRQPRRSAQQAAFAFLALAACAAAEPPPSATNAPGFLLLPFVIYAPETKANFTLTVLTHFRTAGASTNGQPSGVLVTSAYTELNQESLSILPEVYSEGDTYHLGGEATYELWPNKFFGIGNHTLRSSEEDYTSRNQILRLDLGKTVLSCIRVGPQYEYCHYRLTQTQPDGLLAQGTIPGSQGGNLSGCGAVVAWDTRDDVLYSSRGQYVRLAVTEFADALGSDFSFQRYRLDARQFGTLFKSSVLALQEYLNVTRGDVPFQQLSLLGDSSQVKLMRGYLQGRFRDRDEAVVQAEYRMPLWWRLGLDVFGGMGAVAHDLTEMRLDDVKFSGGAGLRLRVSDSEAINMRLDVAFGEEQPGVYFELFEAF